jgi:hypothetical protein
MPCTGVSSFRFIFENLHSVPCVCKLFSRKVAGMRAHQQTAFTTPAAIWVCFICNNFGYRFVGIFMGRLDT